MTRVAVLYLLAAALLVTPVSRAPAQNPPADPYKLILVNGPGSYWGYARPKTPLADVIDSEGQYLISKQQARMQNEKVRQEKIETHKKEIEFWVWYENYMADRIEERRRQERERQIRRAEDEPPYTEIYAAISLNILLEELKKFQPSAEKSLKIDPDWLPHIHVRSVANQGLGMLSQEKVFWPFLLRTAEFKGQRDQIEKMLKQAKQEVKTSHGVDPEVLVELQNELKTLQERIDRGNKASAYRHDVIWTPDNIIFATRFRRQVSDAVRTLQNEPDAAFYLQQLKGQTVSELVEYMKGKGLVFGEALVGDERQYVSLHRTLAEELSRVRGSSPAPK